MFKCVCLRDSEETVGSSEVVSLISDYWSVIQPISSASGFGFIKRPDWTSTLRFWHITLTWWSLNLVQNLREMIWDSDWGGKPVPSGLCSLDDIKLIWELWWLRHRNLRSSASCLQNSVFKTVFKAASWFCFSQRGYIVEDGGRLLYYVCYICMCEMENCDITTSCEGLINWFWLFVIENKENKSPLNMDYCLSNSCFNSYWILTKNLNQFKLN